MTQSILSKPSASGCLPSGFWGGEGFALGRSSIVNSMTRRKAESAAVLKKKTVYMGKCVIKVKVVDIPTDFRMLSHFTLSMSVRRSPSSTIALFMSSYIIHALSMHHPETLQRNHKPRSGCLVSSYRLSTRFSDYQVPSGSFVSVIS